jgi:hypothetical protein
MATTVPVDEIIAQITARLHTLQWLVGLSMACPGFLLSGVIGAAVGILLKFR